MVAEGIIALIWAAAGVTFYTHGGSLLDGMAGLSGAISAQGPGGVVYDICTTLLGPVGGVRFPADCLPDGRTACHVHDRSLCDLFLPGSRVPELVHLHRLSRGHCGGCSTVDPLLRQDLWQQEIQ